ncbi:AAA family ATPase [Streptomyces sp. NPDC004609]|uniref:helix-turn-helix transcriptional regulator n=1 Tax=Streptomyces sp. NPDC004609 TaxID=3364704 RepID=UPI0036904D0A
MTAGPWHPDRETKLIDRRTELDRLLRLVEAVRRGESRVLVVRGEPGVGKTALLDRLTDRVSGSRVLHVAGVQSEMELVFAGLHQMCAPFLDRLDALPAPQRAALRIAFGLSEGSPPNRFLVALAVLGLLSEVAGDEPLVCVVDDHQWLDRASAQALGFVARRLAADPIGLVFGTRLTTEELAGLPEMHLSGLSEQGAQTLLDSALTGPLDTRVRDQIVAETGGNPLAVLELLRALPRDQLAGGFGLPGAVTLSSRIEKSFLRQLDGVPGDTRRLLLLAAADPTGDTALVCRAAGRLGIPPQAATPAAEAGLARFSARVWFRHPLLRSAVYRAASAWERQAAHLALAEATDPGADPDRRAWHRAQAAPGPDEAVAADLERSSGRAQARGGPAASAAMLEKAIQLTAEPARRADRFLAAAQANLKAGSYGKSQELLALAEAEPLSEVQRARAGTLRGHVAFASGRGSEAAPLLLQAARRLEPLDLGLARETYLTAWLAAMFAGGLATGGSLAEVSQAARELPRSRRPDRAEVLLDALSLVITSGPAAAAPALRGAVDAMAAADLSAPDAPRWGWLAHAAAVAMWDHDAWRSLLEREAEALRAVGAFDLLPVVLVALTTVTAWAGDFAAAAALIAESDAVCEATGAPADAFGPLTLAALRGEADEAAWRIEAMTAGSPGTGREAPVTYANWAAAVLYNGLGRYDDALAAATRADDGSRDLFAARWALPELVEAAVRSGNPDLAADPMARLAASALSGGTDLGAGIESRCRALLSEGGSAERLYREAVDRLARTRCRPELGRAHLLYGEWLRREGRRADARSRLRDAYDMLTAVGMSGYAERARRELLATGETVRKRTVETLSDLTPREALIARLACDGRTNQEIGTTLFISPRTVEWHLRKVFGKLGITSRRELNAALTRRGHLDRPA